MSEEQEQFKKEVEETLQSIFTKINGEEKEFLNYLVYKFNLICERNFKAIEYIENHYEDRSFDEIHDEMLKILNGEE